VKSGRVSNAEMNWRWLETSPSEVSMFDPMKSFNLSCEKMFSSMLGS
jgi:hypothetical protein